MYGYIYETTNLTNSKKYIGQKKSSKFLGNDYLGSGKIIKQAIVKYGKDNFKVKLLEACDTQEDLDKKEKYYIKKLRDNYPIELIYNIAKGGNGGNLRYFYSSSQLEEWKFKISKSKLGQKPWNYNKINAFSKEARAKMSKAHKGIPLSEEHKKKLSIANKISQNKPEAKLANSIRTKKLWQNESFRQTVINSLHKAYEKPEVRAKISKIHKGIPLSEEHKKKISDYMKTNGPWIKGKKHSKETRKKLSESHKGKSPYCKNRIAVHDGIKRKYIDKEDLQMYLDKGYKLGYPSRKGDD